MEKGRMQEEERRWGGGKKKKEDKRWEGAIGNTGRLTFSDCLIHVLPTDALLLSSFVSKIYF